MSKDKKKNDWEDTPEHRSTENGCEDGCEACALERIPKVKKIKRRKKHGNKK